MNGLRDATGLERVGRDLETRLNFMLRLGRRHGMLRSALALQLCQVLGRDCEVIIQLTHGRGLGCHSRRQLRVRERELALCTC